MRRLPLRTVVAGAIVTSLSVVPIAAPFAAAADPPAQASCGSLGPPICDGAKLLKTLLAPLEPLFATGIPITDSLGATIHGLQATLEQVIGDPEAVNAQDLAKQIGDVLGLLRGAPEPVATSLSLLGLSGLISTLTDLQTALQAKAAADASAAAVAAAATPTSVPASAGLLPRAALQSGVVVPAAPVGAPLELPELALPDFGGTVTGSADLTTSALAADVDLPSLLAPKSLDTTNDAAALAAAMAFSGGLLTAGVLIGRVRQRRRRHHPLTASGW